MTEFSYRLSLLRHGARRIADAGANIRSDDPGFSVEDAVFSRGEMASVLTALEMADVARSRAGARHVLSIATVRELAGDSRLRDIAMRFIGPAVIPFRATLFDKSSRANWLVVWHQDTALPLRNRVDDPAWGPWSTKAGSIYAHAPAAALEKIVALRVSLDDSEESNGPLRVLPHSHAHGVLSAAEIERWAASVTPVDCLTPSGGVVAIRPLTLHASSKSVNGRPRRVLHVEYTTTDDFGNGLMLAVC